MEWPADYHEQFWSLYPKKVEKKTAMEKLERIKKSGVPFENVMEGLKKYLLWLKSTTEWRPDPKHPATWLNKECWNDEHPTGVLSPGTSDQMEIEQAVKMFAKIGVWSRYAGPEPGLTGCRASTELLSKYGLAPDGRRYAKTS